MTVMSDTGAHARTARLSGGQKWLAGGFVAFGIALTPIAFLVMLITVIRVLRPSFGEWAWTVPVGTEAGFVGLFCADLLLEWKRRPLRVLRGAPYVLALASLSLNLYAAAGSAPAMIGHAVLPLLFFGYILAAEVVVRRLSVTDEERAVEEAMADALAHARDLVRERLGPAWRLRCPSLLRRQIRSRRATATVRQAAESAAKYGRHTELEDATGKWVAGGLAVRAKADVGAETARQDIARQAPPAPVQEAAQDAPQPPAQKAPRTSSRAPSQKVPVSAVQRVRRKGGRKASDEEIREAIRELAAGVPGLKKYRVMKELPVGDERAERLLAEVLAESAEGSVSELPRRHLAAAE